MTANDATGPRSDATEPTRGHRPHDERRDWSAGDFDTTSTGDVAVDLDSAGVDTASSGLAVRPNFWEGVPARSKSTRYDSNSNTTT